MPNWDCSVFGFRPGSHRVLPPNCHAPVVVGVGEKAAFPSCVYDWSAAMGGADLGLVAFALFHDAGHGLMEGSSAHLDGKNYAKKSPPLTPSQYCVSS